MWLVEGKFREHLYGRSDVPAGLVEKREDVLKSP
jgi:hypothetical protein